MLVALNVLWKLNYSANEINVLGAGLGSDVPIFIFGQLAKKGGEILEPITNFIRKSSLTIISKRTSLYKISVCDQSFYQKTQLRFKEKTRSR